MIPEKYKHFQNFDPDSTVEGMLLMAALVVLTSIDKEDICEGRYGGMNHPDTVMENLWDLTNKIYFEKEYKSFLLTESRNKKINDLIDPL